MSTDKDWEKWGKENPYYGVISDDQYWGKTLSEKTQAEFYKSGKTDIDYIFSNLEKVGIKKREFKLAVDYGCGVGRLTFPLAGYAKKVVGFDVSPSMIETAQVAAQGQKKVEFKVISPSLDNLPKSYDFLNSYIVFQHIPPQKGMRILDALFSRLESEGCFALQLTFGYDRSFMGRSLLFLRERVPAIRYIANIVRGRAYNTPNMRMHAYDLNELNEMLYRHGISEYGTVLTNHGGYWGVFIFGKKAK